MQGRRHTFGVSGLLYQSDLLMYDHQTESLWSQISMHAVAGPLTGERLTPIFVEHTTWAEWRAAHPATLALSTKTGSFRSYESDPYLRYADCPDLMFDTMHFDSRYHPKEWVVGVEIDGTDKVYPVKEFAKAAFPIRDQIRGQRITVHFNDQPAAPPSRTPTASRAPPSWPSGSLGTSSIRRRRSSTLPDCVERSREFTAFDSPPAYFLPACKIGHRHEA